MKKHSANYPNLHIIKKSIRTLYKCLSDEKIRTFTKSLDPNESTLRDGNIIINVQHLASIIARHLQLPTGCIIVTFREMKNPGCVELTPEDGYLVKLRPMYRWNTRDIAAILAHEITHVFLHRHNIRFSDTLENEILTDTSAAYLGVGWLCLNAYRKTESHHEYYSQTGEREGYTKTEEERLGYLTPQEFGYIIGKRAVAIALR